jgi:hypothetical protein
MPCPAGRHESTLPCSPPTIPTGFIHPSYRAAQTETLTDKPSLKRSHQGVANVSSSVGGSLSTLSFEDTTTKIRLSSHRRCGGGIRDRVSGFSRASRRNLLRRLASINRRAFRTFKGRMIFVTLTYPGYVSCQVCKSPHAVPLRFALSSLLLTPVALASLPCVPVSSRILR